MSKRDNNKNCNEKFKDIESYKSLFFKGDDLNYLDNLSLQVISTMNEIKNLDCEYKKYKIKFSKDNISILNLAFKEIKILLWTRFCVQIRGYSETIYFLLNKSKSKWKYKEIDEYIKSTNFISFFCKGKDGKEEYDAISLALHNFNKYNYGKEKWNKSFEKYVLFDKAIEENNMDIIQNEFQTVIQKFRIAEKFECCNVSLMYMDWTPLYKLMAFLSKNK